MKPVSFGSLMIFTLNDDKPKLNIPTLMKAAFSYNHLLKDYTLKDCTSDSFESTSNISKIDSTVFNAEKKFSGFLDNKYKNTLSSNSSQVILSDVDCYVDSKKEQTERKYFLTAATYDDEKKIQDALSQSSLFYVANFNYKP